MSPPLSRAFGAFLVVMVTLVMVLAVGGCTAKKRSLLPSLQNHKLEPFAASGCHFQVSMPGHPQDQSPGPEAKRFVSEDDEIAFGVSEEALPEKVLAFMKANPLSVQSALDGACAKAVKELHGTQTRKDLIQIGKAHIPGREIEGTVLKPLPGRFRYRIYLDSTTARMYTLGVVGFNSRVDSPEANQFLASLVILPDHKSEAAVRKHVNNHKGVQTPHHRAHHDPKHRSSRASSKP